MNIGKNISNIKGPKFKIRINHYLLSTIIIGLTALVCIPLQKMQGYHVVSYIFLFIVSILATFVGIGPVFLAAALSALVWNFFFIPPHYTFHIEKAEDILTFGLFFIIALLSGIFTTRVRRQEYFAREREVRTNALFQLTKELSKASGIDEVISVAIKEIQEHFDVKNLEFYLQDGNNVLSNVGKINAEPITSEETKIAEWVFNHAQKAGANTANFNSIPVTFYPLPGTRIVPGIAVARHEQSFNDDKKVFWETYLTLISNALEREFLDELAQKVKFFDESDRLYKTLFNSISHELRIPVATIMGASDTLINASHPGNVQSELFTEILTASLRLNRLIENLLNMSRLESGRISVRLDWYDINDLFHKVSEELANELKPFSFKIIVPEYMPLVKIDFGLMEQVLYNLLVNSIQHTPALFEIILQSDYKNGELIIQVSDKGPGLPDELLPRIFKKFTRAKSSKTGGLGLGLSIAKGFVEAHKGTIIAENKKEGGAVFTIIIPSENPGIENLQL